MLFEFRSEDYRSLEACETYLEQTIAARQSEEVQYSCELVGKRPCARETESCPDGTYDAVCTENAEGSRRGRAGML